MKKISGRKLFLIVILFISFLQGRGQESDFITRLKTQLLLFRTQKADQFIVLQSDKSLYRQGEIMWMKGYVTDAVTHSLSLNSLELSVQLTNCKGVNVLEGKYLLRNGVADFDLKIPADLPSDVYYLIAYTPEMENGDVKKIFKKEIIISRPENLDMIPHLDFPKSFFNADCKEFANLSIINFSGKPLSGKKFDYQIYNQEHELLSGKGKTNSNGFGEVIFFTTPSQNGLPLFASLSIPAAGRDHLNLISKIPLASDKINVRFYPEGGTRVPGILQRIVFEATDQLGNPVDIQSDILDPTGKVLLSAATEMKGLGAFNLLNNDEGKITMRISGDCGRNQEFQLPGLSQGSMSLSVKKNDGRNLYLVIGRTPKSDRGKFKIVAVSSGEIVWASEFELEQSGVITVPLDNFNSEMASFAVFNNEGVLVSQRIAYTGKEKPMHISITSNKNTYKTSEEGVIKVKITDTNGSPVKAELAVTLADKYSFPSSSQLIESLIYGLERPVLINEPMDKIDGAVLDYLLISNNLRGFDWNLVLAVDPAKGSSKGSTAIRISGIVLDEQKVPVPGALVSLNSSALQQFSTTCNQRGEFALNLPVSVDRNSLLASATDGSGKQSYKVKLNKSFKDEIINSLNNTAVYDWNILDQIYKAGYFQTNPDFYKIRSSVRIRGEEKKPMDPYWKKYLNGTTNLLEIIKTIHPFEMSGEKIVFRGMNSFLAQDGALIVVDGQRMGTDASQLSIVNPQDVEDIRILLDPVEMGMYSGLNSVGVIEIKTKRGFNNENRLVESSDKSLNTTPKVFSPEPIGEAKYDLKTTLQWVPVLYTDEHGELTIPFKTGSIKSSFILELSGISNHRQWIGARSEIRVE